VKQQKQQQQQQQQAATSAALSQQQQPQFCFVNVPNGVQAVAAAVTTQNGSAPAAAVTSTSISALLPTVPIPPQQTHIAVAAVPTAPAMGRNILSR
jgi:hypothetical protein